MKKVVIGAVLLGLAATQPAQAVYIEFNGTPGVTPLSMTFAEDVTFTITKSTTASMLLFAIDGLFETPDDDQTVLRDVFSTLLEFSVNTGSNVELTFWGDNPSETMGDVTINDGYFFAAPSGGFSFGVGDIVTLHAGTMTTSGNGPADFNLGTSGNYNMFLTGEDGASISNVVPEPASAMMLLFGAGIGMVIHRARRWANR
jgi:hypothetical protein